MEFFVSRISCEGILGMVFLARQKCTLYLEKGDVIPLVDEDSRLLANQAKFLEPITLPPGIDV